VRQEKSRRLFDMLSIRREVRQEKFFDRAVRF
jgi:hypothetical protein